MHLFFLKKKKRIRLQGFTLVELLVASAIFSSVLVIAVGSLFTAQTINTRLQETQIIMDSVNLSIEVLAKDVRYGSEFHCDTLTPATTTPIDSTVYISGSNGTTAVNYSLRYACEYPVGGGVIVFKPISPLPGTTNSVFDRVVYTRATTTLPNGLEVGTIVKHERPYGAPARIYQITASDVNVTSFKVYAKGVNSTTGTVDMGSAVDSNQPLISLVISGKTIPSDTKTEPVRFDITTGVSPRGLDN